MDMREYEEEVSFFQAEFSYARGTAVRTRNVAATARQMEAVLGTSFPRGTVFFGCVVGASNEQVLFWVWVAPPCRVKSSVVRAWITDVEEPNVNLVSVSRPESHESDGMFFARTRGSDGTASELGVYVRLAEVEGTQCAVASDVLVKHADGMRDGVGSLPQGAFFSVVSADTDWERRCEDSKRMPCWSKSAFTFSEWVQSGEVTSVVHGRAVGSDLAQEGYSRSLQRTSCWVQAQSMYEEFIDQRAAGR